MAHHPLKKWRFEKDITLEKLAGRLKTSISYLSMLENGKRTPSLRFAVKIQRLTGGAVKIEDFSTGAYSVKK